MRRNLPAFVVVDVDRYGKRRFYLRVKGRKKVRLDGIPWTPEFMAAYARAKAEDAPDCRGPQSDSWEWLCRQYFVGGMKHLGERTKRVRRAILTRTFAERINPESPVTFGDMPVGRMGRKAIEVLRDRLIAVPASANERVKAIRHVFAYAVKEHEELVQANPGRDVEYIRLNSDGFYTWTEDDAAQFDATHPIGTKAYLAKTLLLYSGCRRSDVVILGKQHTRNGRLKFKPFKTRNTTGDVLDLPMLPKLQEAIEAGPCGDLTFLVTEWGKPYTANGFGNWFRRQCRSAGLPLCSAHGLRKLGATLAALNGASDAELQAIFGWASAKMAQKYRRSADKKRLADGAMHKIRVQRLDSKKSNSGK